MNYLVRRCKRQRPRSRTGTLADFAHGGGNIAGSLDALERRAHFRKKPVKTLVLGALPITSGVGPRGQLAARMAGSDPGDNVDNRWCHATV